MFNQIVFGCWFNCVSMYCVPVTDGIIDKYVLIVVVVVVCKPKGYGIMDNDMIN